MDIIIETPKGSREKYDFDKEVNAFRLSKRMPEGVTFPFDFGFIPNTKGEDGDPLDVLMIAEFTTFTGCYVECRIVGALKAKQKEKDGREISNDRFIAIPESSILYSMVNNLSDLPQKMIDELEAFFTNYNKQAGKEFTVLKKLDAAAATKLI